VVVSWLIDLIVHAVAAIVDRRRGKNFDPSRHGEARFDSRTGKQIK